MNNHITIFAIVALLCAFALWHGYTTPGTPGLDANGGLLSLRDGVR